MSEWEIRPRKQIHDPSRWRKMKDMVRIVNMLYSEAAIVSSQPPGPTSAHSQFHLDPLHPFHITFWFLS